MEHTNVGLSFVLDACYFCIFLTINLKADDHVCTYKHNWEKSQKSSWHQPTDDQAQ